MLHPIVKDGKWGYINNQGKIVIEPQFDMARDFHDGLALVTKYGATYADDRYGYIDETGKLVIEQRIPSTSRDFTDEFTSRYRFSEGLAVIPSEYKLENNFNRVEKTACLDKTGKTLFELDTNHRVRSVFSDGLLLVEVREPGSDFEPLENVSRANVKYGYVDRTGKFVIEPKYSLAKPFSEGLAAVTIGGQQNGSYKINDGYIDKTGKVVIEPQFDNALRFSEGLAAVMDSSDKWKYIDQTGKVVVTPEDLSISGGGEFHDGIAVVRSNTGYSLIDKSGKSPFPSAFKPTDKSLFSGGLMLVSDLGGKFQIIDKEGEIVATPDFSSAGKDITVGEFRGGVARVLSKDNRDLSVGYVNKKGEWIWKITK
ncbi:MAG: WG repeat-containing protein [Acidobacteria bacterium]|nr:WG repeat-containing protein [Acidobacteriota bacterium]